MEYNNSSHTWNSSPGTNGSPQNNSCAQTCSRIKEKKTIAMLVGSGLIIFLCILGYYSLGEASLSKPSASIDTLKLTTILFRHGARTPTWLCNGDPYKSYNWPEGLGGLTNKGKLQVYELGTNIRSRYGSFLPEYKDDDIYVLSSASPRTLKSAYTFLAGLYPPNKHQLWNPKIFWQPIPVNSLPRYTDNILALKKPCKRSKKEHEAVGKSEYVSEIIANHSDIYKFISEKCNQTIETLLDAEFLYSTIIAEKSYGLSVPEWTKQRVYLDQLAELTAISFRSYSFNDVLKRLKGGPLLSEIVNNMQLKHSNTLKPNRKIIAYSGHDLTMVTLMRTLGFEESLVPDYTAAFVIELHQMPNATDSEVQMFFIKNTTYPAKPLTIPFCDAPCSLSQFVNITSKYIPVNWEEECKLDE